MVAADPQKQQICQRRSHAAVATAEGFLRGSNARSPPLRPQKAELQARAARARQMRDGEGGGRDSTRDRTHATRIGQADRRGLWRAAPIPKRDAAANPPPCSGQ